LGNEAKTRFNAARYTQVKISVEPDLAAAFKISCEAAGVSMASVLKECMANHCSAKISAKQSLEPYKTRSLRRKAVIDCVARLNGIKDAEEGYRDNIPDNLQGSIVYETADNTVELLEDAIDLLVSAY
jgi:hypothetical protein